MEDFMSWQDQIPGCFGAKDALFANHPRDERRAEEAIKNAKAAGATFEDFEKEIVWYCYKEVTGTHFQEHLGKQVAKARKLWGQT
jgi:hypothetical protein